jgi:uncharacterized protein YjbI with pentapeptide repeats
MTVPSRGDDPPIPPAPPAGGRIARDLAGIPFAASLTPHSGALAPDSDYDGVHFDGLSLDEPRAASSRFIECVLTGVTFHGGRLTKARFRDVWLRDVRLVATGLGETEWTDVTVAESVWAGAEVFGAELRRVTLRGCKLDSVNFRGTSLTDVVFDGCELLDVDFKDAVLTRTSFPRSRLTRTDLTGARLDATDLRDAELGIIIGPDSLRGAIISSAQLIHVAPVLAQTMGITVSDD